MNNQLNNYDAGLDEGVQLPPIPAGTGTYAAIIGKLWQDIPADMIESLSKGGTTLSYVHVWFVVGLLEHCAPGFITTSSKPFVGPLGQVSVRVSVYIPTADRGWVRRDNFGTENPYVPDITPDGQAAPYGYGWERGSGGLVVDKSGNYRLVKRPAESMDAVTNAWAQGFARAVSSFGLSIGLRWAGNKRRHARTSFFEIIGGAPGAMVAGVPLAADYEEAAEDDASAYEPVNQPRPPAVIAPSRNVAGNGDRQAGHNGSNGSNSGVVSPTAEPATEAQVRAIYVAGRNQRRLDKAAVTALAVETFGREPEALTKREASRFIDTLKQQAAA